MYCTARQTSQGTQRQYTASSIGFTEDLYEPNRKPRQLNRQTNAIQFDDDFELPILEHTMSDFADTPYLTPQASQLMREISRPIDYNNDYNYNDYNNDYNNEVSISTQEIN